jgi:predicted sugar kinase
MVKRTGCEVSVPLRASISVLDMTSLYPGRPGGGNAGFALSPRLGVCIRPSDVSAVKVPMSLKGEAIVGLKSLIHHILETWCRLGSCQEQYAIEVTGPCYRHVGLGFHAALTMAIYFGLNWLYGNPLRDSELIHTVTHHYVEPVGSALEAGFTTGLASFLALYGGFAVIDTKLRAVFHSAAPLDWRIIILAPEGVPNKAFGPVELENTMISGRRQDELDRNEKTALVSSELILAVQARDLRRVGKVIECIQKLGSKQAEIELYNGALGSRLDDLRRANIECVIFSATGPGVVLISKQSSAKLKGIATGLGFSVLHDGTVDNRGLVVKTVI